MSDYAHDLANAFEEKVFYYLDHLKNSNEHNMVGVVPNIVKIFGVDRFEARTLLKAWIERRTNEGKEHV